MLAPLLADHKHAYSTLRCNCAYMNTLSDRMTELMQATGWSIGKIAEVAAVSSSAVSQWVNGQTQSIKLEPAIRIERESGFSALWIANGKGEKRANLPPPSDEMLEPEYAGRPRRSRRIPVVGTAKLGSDGYYEEISPILGGGDGAIEMASEDPNAYSLRVRGQSMFPAIRDGWYVLIEPNGQPRTGEYVLLKLKDGRKMVKELLIRRASSVEVMSVNGGERMTFDIFDVASIQAVGAVVSPSKWIAE